MDRDEVKLMLMLAEAIVASSGGADASDENRALYDQCLKVRDNFNARQQIANDLMTGKWLTDWSTNGEPTTPA